MNEKIIPTPSSIHSANNIDYGQILKPNDFNLDLFAFVGAKIKGFKFKRFNVFFPKRNQGKSSWNNGLLSKIRFSTNSIKYIINLRKNLNKLSNL